MYIYAGIQVIYEKTIESGKETKYIGRIAKIEKMNGTETTTYFHIDHLGSTRAVTDSAGNLLTTLQYDPFGEVRSGSNNGIRYTFTGKEQDATGLYYYGARYYDPKVGRFITRDVFSGRIGNPQTQNRYVYVMNNPLKHNDPTGNWPPEDDEGGGSPTPTCNGSCQAKVTKHPVNQVKLLEIKLRDAARSLTNKGLWPTIKSMFNSGNPISRIAAVGIILTEANIPFGFGGTSFSDPYIKIKFGSTPTSPNGSTWTIHVGKLPEDVVGSTDPNAHTITLDCDKIEEAGDLFLLLGHELIHAYQWEYDIETYRNENKSELEAYSWEYVTMGWLETMTPISQSYGDETTILALRYYRLVYSPPT